MRAQLVTLRYSPSLGGFDDRPLAEFVADKELLAVREHFFRVHDVPHLACLVLWHDAGAAGHEAARPEQKRVRATSPVTSGLDEQERILFGTLREWRRKKARTDGVPPYVILNNRQLAALVRQRPQTPNALLTIDGIGPAKLERYGEELLRLLGGGEPQAHGEKHPGDDRPSGKSTVGSLDEESR